MYVPFFYTIIAYLLDHLTERISIERLPLSPCLYSDESLLSKLQSVANQVKQDLLDPLLIRVHHLRD